MEHGTGPDRLPAFPYLHCHVILRTSSFCPWSLFLSRGRADLGSFTPSLLGSAPEHSCCCLAPILCLRGPMRFHLHLAPNPICGLVLTWGTFPCTQSLNFYRHYTGTLESVDLGSSTLPKSGSNTYGKAQWNPKDQVARAPEKDAEF